jgi:ParB-like chromosome segregation protein Spo0J
MLDLRTLPIDQLKPAPYNPRVKLTPGSPGYRRLERSLAEFSLVEPLVWNEQTGHVVGGHQRLEILKNQGAHEVDVVVVSLSLEREKALNIALNNAQVGGDWDTEKLIDVVGELIDLDNFDATLTGFDPADLHDLVLAPETELAPETPDETEPDVVRITLEIPPERWEDVRPRFDEFVAQCDVRAHIKLPHEGVKGVKS